MQSRELVSTFAVPTKPFMSLFPTYWASSDICPDTYIAIASGPLRHLERPVARASVHEQELDLTVVADVEAGVPDTPGQFDALVGVEELGGPAARGLELLLRHQAELVEVVGARRGAGGDHRPRPAARAGLQGIKVVKAYTMERHERRRFGVRRR